MIRKAHRFLNGAKKEGVQTLGNSISNIIIFGSKVTGDFDAESDIDILVILNQRTWAIQDVLTGVNNRVTGVTH